MVSNVIKCIDMSLQDLDWELISISQKDGYLTRNQASKYLGVSTATIRRYEQSRDLPCYKVGFRKFYKRDELDAWLLRESKK